MNNSFPQKNRKAPSASALRGKKAHTSWERHAEWYDRHLEHTPDTYQRTVILPNLLRLMGDIRGKHVLDCACGQGFFLREYHTKGAHCTGVDASPSLIRLAKKQSPQDMRFFTGSADRMSFAPAASADAVTLILAIQNIRDTSAVFAECARVLKPSGALYIVMNHPAFRIPQKSCWGWDEKAGIQYRRIDQYMTEASIRIQMHPGAHPSETTLSFHRPLQYYIKALSKHGYAVARFEEWISNKKSGPGPRARAENRARHEIPLFAAIKARLVADRASSQPTRNDARH